MQPGIPSAFFAAIPYCWLMFNLVSTTIPRSFSAKLLSSWVTPSIMLVQEFALLLAKLNEVPVRLSKFLWMWPSGVSATPPSCGKRHWSLLSAHFLRVHPGPSSRSLMKMGVVWSSLTFLLVTCPFSLSFFLSNLIFQFNQVQTFHLCLWGSFQFFVPVHICSHGSAASPLVASSSWEHLLVSSYKHLFWMRNSVQQVSAKKSWHTAGIQWFYWHLGKLLLSRVIDWCCL